MFQQLSFHASGMTKENPGYKIDLNNSSRDHKFLSGEHGRQLDHNLDDVEKLTGTDNTLRAGKTSSGFCIEYRESLFEHFDRIGRLFEKEPPLLSNLDIGMDRGMKMYGMGMQGSEGDQTGEKPSFIDVLGGMKWDAWEDYRGIKKEFCQKIFIVFASELLVEEGLGKWIENPNRPGPDYYSECK